MSASDREPLDAVPGVSLPLRGIKVVELSHTILGPCCGMILGDLGAEVVKVEPPGGERTRRLRGFGAGYFGFFNRNKTSIELDYSTPDGVAALRDLLATADVMIENMGPGAMERAGLSPDEVHHLNPALVYCRLKGFLPGPYESRVALDEVVQMMSGLAYMTGPPGMPLRCGTSITDISAAIFGAVGVLAALRERDATGVGSVVDAALFETAAFLMGQHMAYSAVVGQPVPPMPARVSAWAVYDLFTLRDGQVFVGITSDKQWRSFCSHTGRDDLANDSRLTSNEDRILARDWLMPELTTMFGGMSCSELAALCDTCGLPFGHLANPEALFSDPHLIASGALADTILPGGQQTRLPKLPIRIDGYHFDLRKQPPPTSAPVRGAGDVDG